MKKNLLVITILLIFSISSLYAERVTLVTDEYWEAIIENEHTDTLFEKARNVIANLLNLETRRKIREYGVLIEKIIISNNEIADSNFSVAKLTDLLKNDIIILSPLLSVYAEDFAIENADKKFIVITEQNKTYKGFNNIFVFKIDYFQAMSNAGIWAAESGMNTIAVFYCPNTVKQEEMNAFLQGWNSIETKNNLYTLTLKERDFVNRTYLDKVTTKFSNYEDVKIGAVFTGGWNTSIIEKIELLNIQLISKNAKIWKDLPYNINCSVEISEEKMLLKIIKSISKNTFQNGGEIEAQFFSP